MPKGDILVSPSHKFESGEEHKKYFILLSNPEKTNNYVIAITTSKQKWRNDRKGCHPNDKGPGYFVFKRK